MPPKPITPSKTPPLPPITTPKSAAEQLLDELKSKAQSGAVPTGGATKPTTTTTTVPGAPSGKSAAQQLLEQLQGGKTAISPTAPTPKTNFVGPTLDEDIIRARASLDVKVQQAIAAGVREDLANSIAAGKKPNIGWQILGKVINFDVVPGKGQFQPVRTVVVPTVTTLDTGRRVVLSTIKEVGDELSVWRNATIGGGRGRGETINPETGKPYKFGAGGFSWSDFIDQASRSSTIGYGDFISTGNIWGDRILGFIGDVVLDPLTYVSGPGGIAKTATQRGVAAGGKQAVEAIAREADRAAAIVAKQAAEEAVAASTSPAALRAAEKALEAATKRLDDITKDVANETTRRVLGGKGREALAQSVVATRREAEDVLATGVKDGIAATADDLAQARAAVAALGDDVISRIPSEGYAALVGPVKDILRGVQTPAAQVLGLRGGLRVFNPLKGVGIGGRYATIPFTDRFTNLLGKAISKAKFGDTNLFGLPLRGLVKTKVGNAIIQRIIPRGEQGLFGSTDIFRLRKDLRTGVLKGREAVEALELLKIDNLYRQTVSLTGRQVNAAVDSLLGDANRKVLESIGPYLQSDPSSWSARGLAALRDGTPEKELYDKVRSLFDEFYAQSKTYSDLFTGADLGMVPNYFPRVQTRQAIEWAEKNAAEAAKLAAEEGVDRTWFLGNFTARDLKAGDLWFGRRLTPDDIAAGPVRLNELARASGKINFDYFETNVADIIKGYAKRHGDYLAYAQTVGTLADKFPELARATLPSLDVGGLPDMADLLTLDARVATLTPDALGAWSRDRVVLLQTQLDALLTKLSAPDIITSEFERQIRDVGDYIDAVEKGISDGTITPMMGVVAQNEIDNYAIMLADQMNNINRTIGSVSPDKWKQIVKVAEDGYTILNDITVPDVSVRSDLIDMFKNVERLKDPAFAAAADKALGWFNRWWKGYVVATPGFHSRNALGNFMGFVTAGGNPKNFKQGVELYRAITQFVRNAPTDADFGALLLNAADELKRKGLVKTQIEGQNALIALTGSTGFGQFAETLEGLGARRTGILGGAARNRASEILGYPVWKSRQIGINIEDYMRYALLWDGLKQGMDLQEASARVTKYLVDYNDLTTLDRNLKQIIPFWMWMSRNIPLQMENMWTNPRVYAYYESFRRNFEDKEGTSPYVPDWLKLAGGFKLPIGERTYIRPQLGFPGVGEESVIDTLIRSPEELLSRVSPLVRVPLEAISNKQFFSGAPITKKGDLAPTWDRFIYTLRQFGAPLSPLQRLANATPARRWELYQQITGTKSSENEPQRQELNALLSFIGSPVFQLRQDQEKQEIWRRFFELVEEEEKEKAKTKAEQKK